MGLPNRTGRITVKLRKVLSSLYTQKGFRGPVLTLFTGSSAALLVAYLCEPVLTRLYTAADYKVMGYFSALASLLFSISSLRYDDALMLQKKDSDAAAVVWLSWVVMAFLVVVAGIGLIWKDSFAQQANIPAIAPYLVLIVPVLAAMRIARTMELWLVRAKAFRLVMAGQTSNTGVMVASRIGVGVPPVSAGAGGLIGGYLAGNVAAALINTVAAIREGGRVLLRPPPCSQDAEGSPPIPAVPIVLDSLQSRRGIGLPSTCFPYPTIFRWRRAWLLRKGIRGAGHTAQCNR